MNRTSGVTTLHYLSVERKDGKVVRKYVRRDELPKYLADNFERRKRRDINIGLRKYEKAMRARYASPSSALAGLVDAGLSVNSCGRIGRSRRTFFTQEAATYRFALLDAPLREMLGTPENLLGAERKADSMLHSAVRKGVRGITFEACFRAVMAGILVDCRETPSGSSPDISCQAPASCSS